MQMRSSDWIGEVSVLLVDFGSQELCYKGRLSGEEHNVGSLAVGSMAYPCPSCRACVRCQQWLLDSGCEFELG